MTDPVTEQTTLERLRSDVASCQCHESIVPHECGWSCTTVASLLAVAEAAAELSENAGAGIPWPKIEKLRAALAALNDESPTE